MLNNRGTNKNTKTDLYPRTWDNCRGQHAILRYCSPVSLPGLVFNRQMAIRKDLANKERVFVNLGETIWRYYTNMQGWSTWSTISLLTWQSSVRRLTEMVIIEHMDWIWGVMYARNAKREQLAAGLIVIMNYSTVYENSVQHQHKCPIRGMMNMNIPWVRLVRILRTAR